ncbi:tRNA(Arg) A34 adenosine deaminase TadA [Friedmanniella endophytica]|uniref:tRNA(Arg) A34 adenosine deaminase TadA n=1 Tax=Microlunatus kandeliicorticis TaxID=1759536 RepID=A0A7W3P6K9_9ACTN|nr:nucleoside deaminase [Microlunatus kandeliicorticis]MBA8795057.1 tRNA(Arg) A34 adenosine deaminase TadA [Microlunatus kandeliicorticis]
MSLDDLDHRLLTRAVELAEEAVDAGDEPFGSVLAGADGTVLAEDRNRVVSTGDPTAHPEIALARWAALHLDADARAAATVYTSGEHCPMCAAAHGWVGLARIVYASSTAQLQAWSRAWSAGDVAAEGVPVVVPLPVQQVAPRVRVEGPDDRLAPRVHALHERFRRS